MEKGEQPRALQLHGIKIPLTPGKDIRGYGIPGTLFYCLSLIHIWRCRLPPQCRWCFRSKTGYSPRPSSAGSHCRQEHRRSRSAVSYTHLDVYKRQPYSWTAPSARQSPCWSFCTRTQSRSCTPLTCVSFCSKMCIRDRHSVYHALRLQDSTGRKITRPPHKTLCSGLATLSKFVFRVAALRHLSLIHI